MAGWFDTPRKRYFWSFGIMLLLFLVGVAFIGAGTGGAFTSKQPTIAPTITPSINPTTHKPTSHPTANPTKKPTAHPSKNPTKNPTTAAPT